MSGPCVRLGAQNYVGAVTGAMFGTAILERKPDLFVIRTQNVGWTLPMRMTARNISRPMELARLQEIVSECCMRPTADSEWY